MEKRKKYHLSLAAVRLWLLVFALILSKQVAIGQQSLETQYRLTGDTVTALFERHRQEIQKITAVFVEGRSQVTYGLVISSDGYILTKASEVEGKDGLRVRIDKTEYDEVEVVKVDKVWDVALVKVGAIGLDVPVYAESGDIPQGAWVVVNGATSRMKRRVLVGVISANSREIPAAGGAVLGIVLKEEKGKLYCEQIAEGGGAEKAGLKKGDELISIDEKEMKKIDDLTEFMKEMEGGKEVKVVVVRDKKRIEVYVLLSARKELFQEQDRNDMMSGDYSKRRSGFPRIIQHDVLANSETMGGPVLNIEGKVIGMNIARANRAETFAIPLEELKMLAEKMLGEARK